MTNHANHKSKRHFFQRCLTLLAVAAVNFVATLPAAAQLSPNGFAIGVSDDINISLNDAEIASVTGGDAGAQMSFVKRSAWRFENILQMDFSRPEFLFVNDPASTDVVSSIEITIGDTDFNFDRFPVLPEFSTEDILILPIIGMEIQENVIASVLDSSGATVGAGDADADVLFIDLSELPGGGLQPGEQLTFIAQLGSDTPGLAPPEFDEVLYGLDGDLSNNSVVTATFTSSSGDEFLASETFEDVTLDDLMTSGHSNEFRDFDGQVQTATVIPEPGALSVLSISVALLATRVRRRPLSC